MFTGWARYSENMNVAAFSWMNFEFTSVKETGQNKEGSTLRNACHKWLHCTKNEVFY